VHIILNMYHNYNILGPTLNGAGVVPTSCFHCWWYRI